MVTKELSTRASIVKRSKGMSAVEKASYISRSTLECSFDGNTYYPKYHEDLVHSEIMLPVNAPAEYSDRATLWNAVETAEKSKDAQLARMYKVSIPNEWSYDYAVDVMRDYIKRNFVDKGICADFAIHDSENPKTHQRNLHCHIMLTMRGIDENGKWLPKQKKVYLKDENGDKIPLIDKKTGKQKVDKQNRKQWKCQSVPTNDWNSRENAKLWRADLAETINKANEKVGVEDVWEHRSFAERGLDILPTVHIGAVANAMEQKGIQTDRGNINRQIAKHNHFVRVAKNIYDKAVSKLEAVKQSEKVQRAKNEIIDMVHKIADKYGALKLPVMNTKYIHFISDRAILQKSETMERFVDRSGAKTFQDLRKYDSQLAPEFESLMEKRHNLMDRASELNRRILAYEDYVPYRDIVKSGQTLTGKDRKKYEREHKSDYESCTFYKERLESLLKGEKVTPKAWRREVTELEAQIQTTDSEYARLVTNLSSIEVLEYNRKYLEQNMEQTREQEIVEKQTEEKQEPAKKKEIKRGMEI